MHIAAKPGKLWASLQQMTLSLFNRMTPGLSCEHEQDRTLHLASKLHCILAHDTGSSYAARIWFQCKSFELVAALLSRQASPLTNKPRPPCACQPALMAHHKVVQLCQPVVCSAFVL